MTRLRRAIETLGPTLRSAAHLRPTQLLAFVRQRSRGPARSPTQSRAPGCDALQLPEGFVGPSPEGHIEPDGGVVLLGQPAHDPVRFGWTGDGDPLWVYTLHYHGWLADPACTRAQARATVLDWIEEHREGVGWEPYPCSQRLLHWLGWLARDGAHLHAGELELVLASVSAQLQHLASHVELHLDGNHLWTNLVALVAGGLALRGHVPAAMLERFATPLLHCVQAQLGDDGVHAERTPSYHCLLAEQLSLVIALAEPRLPGVADPLRVALEHMLAVLPAFTHPDGDVALWGDSQLQAPVTPMRLAHRCAVALAEGDADASDSGFARRAWGPFTLLWNQGGVGLPQQTGHIHGDCLSIELSYGRTRVLVDAGVGTYVEGDDRRYARSTAAHNTVTVGDRDQHELWKSHRIGGRALPHQLEASARRLLAEVRGYKGAATHRRRVIFDGDRIQITDELAPPVVAGVVRYFVPESLRVRTTDNGALVFLPRGETVELALDRGAFALSQAPGWRAMGKAAPRWCLAADVGLRPTVVTIRALG
ncbi:MAG: heparinase II/III-family protein [Nannocystaceae bacterium]